MIREYAGKFIVLGDDSEVATDCVVDLACGEISNIQTLERPENVVGEFVEVDHPTYPGRWEAWDFEGVYFTALDDTLCPQCDTKLEDDGEKQKCPKCRYSQKKLA
jgi:tRNA(Ile2) C34 agmatinyltransferase TiaS